MRQSRGDKQNTRKKGKVRRIIGIILPLLIFLLGLGLLLYPTFSNWWNQQHQSRAIATYQDAIENNDDGTIDEMLAAAEAYNEQLLADRQAGSVTINRLTDEQREEYNSLLDITGTGIMGYIKIPKIDVELPIYHGTDEAVLQIAIGHIEGTSLPVGGKGTHIALSGHRGLPSAKLFTDIDSLGEGDVFMITVLNRKITYQVDQITTVLPEELQDLEIDPDQDYCTLVTCTPYGINSHRLLVRGHRIDNLIDEDVETIQVDIPDRELSDQERLQQMLPYILIFAAGFFALALIMPSKRKEDDETEEDNRSRWERIHAEREARLQQRRRNYVPKDDSHDDDETYQPYGYEDTKENPEGKVNKEVKDSRPDLKQPMESDEIEFYDADDDVFGSKKES